MYDKEAWNTIRLEKWTERVDLKHLQNLYHAYHSVTIAPLVELLTEKEPELEFGYIVSHL